MGIQKAAPVRDGGYVGVPSRRRRASSTPWGGVARASRVVDSCPGGRRQLSWAVRRLSGCSTTVHAVDQPWSKGLDPVPGRLSSTATGLTSTGDGRAWLRLIPMLKMTLLRAVSA